MTDGRLQPQKSRLAGRLRDVAFRSFDGIHLVLFRITYGVTLSYWSLEYLLVDRIHEYYVLPRYHFYYDGFSWVRVLSSEMMYALFAVISCLGILVALGFFYRVTSLLLGLAFCYVFLLEKTYYQNHYYLLSLVGLLMPLLPCHHQLSLDSAWMRTLRATYVPAWNVFLVRFLVGVPYFYGGIAKINSDWLAGQPMRMVLAKQHSHPFFGAWAGEEWLVTLFVWGGMLFDLLIMPALMWRRTRFAAYLVSVCFHVMNATSFSIGVFPWFMIFATLVFFPPSTFRKFIAIKHTKTYRPPSIQTQKLVVSLLAVFVIAQLLIPFRHHLFAGQVRWNERGHHFSWRMKLRGKTSAFHLEASDPESGAREPIDPRRWLTSMQATRMARDPSLVHQFCRFLKQEYAAQGYPSAQIHSLLLVSLNGRKPQLMIDPSVDLGALPVQWGSPSFVLPLTEPLRHTAWDESRTNWSRHLPERYRGVAPR